MPSGDKVYTVIIQATAADMLVSHSRFLAQASETAAERLVVQFSEKAGTLAHMPERCPWLDDPLFPAYKYRKLLFEKHYLLLFQVVEDTVFVDAMVDCRQDYGWLL